MRLVIATCTVDYAGRLSAHLAEATRLLMVKADGSISIHSDGGAYKPLNWMTPPCSLKELENRWEVTNSKGECLSIQFTEILSDVSQDLGVEPGLVKDGVEAHLQELLAANPHVLEENMTVVCREYFTDIGPVDLLCKDASGVFVAVEVKRRGDIDGVEQLSRYLERLELDGRLRPVRGLFAAQEIRPQAVVLARSRGISTVVVNYEELKAGRSLSLTLF